MIATGALLLMSVTLEPTVRTAEQVRDVYRRLLKLEGLVLLW